MKHPPNLPPVVDNGGPNLAPETVIRTFVQMLERLLQSGVGASPLRGQFMREKP